MKTTLAVGQFWQDQVNKDLLRIESFSLDPISEKVQEDRVLIPGHEKVVGGKTTWIPAHYQEGAWVDGPGTMVEFVKCSCFVHGKFFGVQEMRSSHFEEDKQYEPHEDLPRFIRLSWVGGYWVLGMARLRALWN